MLAQEVDGLCGQVCAGLNAELVHFLFCLWPDPVEAAHW